MLEPTESKLPEFPGHTQLGQNVDLDLADHTLSEMVDDLSVATFSQPQFEESEEPTDDDRVHTSQEDRERGILASIKQDPPLRELLLGLRQQLTDLIQDNLREAPKMGFVENDSPVVSISEFREELLARYEELQEIATSGQYALNGPIEYGPVLQFAVEQINGLLSHLHDENLTDVVSETKQSTLFQVAVQAKSEIAAQVQQLELGEIQLRAQNEIAAHQNDPRVQSAGGDMNALGKILPGTIFQETLQRAQEIERKGPPPVNEVALKLYQALSEVVKQCHRHTSEPMGFAGEMARAEHAGSSEVSIDALRETLKKACNELEEIYRDDSDRTSIGLNYRVFAHNLQVNAESMLIYLTRSPISGVVPENHIGTVMHLSTQGQASLVGMMQELSQFSDQILRSAA